MRNKKDGKPENAKNTARRKTGFSSIGIERKKEQLFVTYKIIIKHGKKVKHRNKQHKISG